MEFGNGETSAQKGAQKGAPQAQAPDQALEKDGPIYKAALAVQPGRISLFIAVLFVAGFLGSSTIRAVEGWRITHGAKVCSMVPRSP